MVRNVIKAHKLMDNRNEMILTKLVSVLMGLIAIIFALKQYNIMSLLVFAKAWGNAFGVLPLVVAIMGFKVHERNYWGTCIGTIIAYVYAETYYPEVRYFAGFCCIVGSVIGFVLAGYVNKLIKKYA